MIGRAMAACVLAALVAAGAPMVSVAADCPAGADEAGRIRCAIAEWQAAERRMYRRYRHARRVLERFDGGAAFSLRVEQATWVLFRDSACAAEAAAFRGQKKARLVFLTCRTAMTRGRTVQLGLLRR